MLIYPNTNYSNAINLDSPIFLEVEKEFWKWLESSNPANEFEEMYFSDDAIYSKKDAIYGAIDELINSANEENKPILISSFDFDAVFN